MAPIELIIVSILRALVEVALFALVGQGVVGFLSGGGRDKNIIYQFFRIVTNPALRLARIITPRLILDKHLPYVAFFLLFWFWLALAYFKRLICATHGLQCF